MQSVQPPCSSQWFPLPEGTALGTVHLPMVRCTLIVHSNLYISHCILPGGTALCTVHLPVYIHWKYSFGGTVHYSVMYYTYFTSQWLILSKGKDLSTVHTMKVQLSKLPGQNCTPHSDGLPVMCTAQHCSHSSCVHSVEVQLGTIYIRLVYTPCDH